MNYLPDTYQGNLTINRYADAYGMDSRGWRVDVLTCDVDGEQAGYLALAYLTAANRAKVFPNGSYDYLRIIGGMTDLPADPSDVEAATEQLQRYGIYLPPADKRRKDKRADFLKRVDRERGKGWMEFEETWFERPMVDNIRVYSDEDENILTVIGKKRGHTRRTTRTDFTGLGLGLLLYREGARWMAETGLALFSNRTPSEAAQQTWGRLRDDLPRGICRTATDAEAGRDRWMLDARYGDIPTWRPEWSTSLTIVSGMPTAATEQEEIEKELQP